MKFTAILCVILALFSASSDAARFPRGSVTAPFVPFVSPLKIGAGGWNTGVVIANDGTRLTRTDTYGGYKFNATSGLWEQLITKARMPAAAFGYFPTTGTSQVKQGQGGLYEIDMVPSDSSKVYTIFNGRFFSSTNGGSTWTLGNLPAQPNDPDGNGGPLDANANYRQNGRKMAVDPNNYLHVLVGSTQNGLYETLDGGTTFTSVTGVPTATADTSGNGRPGYNIAFDPSSAHNCGTGGIQTCTYYVFAYTQTAGTLNGKMWVTNNAGSTWTATTSGPTTMDRLIVAPTGGTVWATDSINGGGGAGGNLWKFASGAWTQVTAAGTNCHSVAVDPNSATHIICVTPAGQIITSNNTGSTWSGLTYTITGTDVPWLPITGGIVFMAAGDAVFDKNVSGLVVFGMGLGVFTSTPPAASGSNVWTSLNAGIEQLVTVDGIAPNGVAVVGNEDRASFYLSSPNTYPSVQNDTYHGSFSLAVTYALDYAASNTNFMAQLITPSFGSSGNNSGTSTDGGQTWRPFNSFYVEGLADSAFVDDGTHKVKITLPSTSGLTTWAFNSSTGSSGSIVRVVGYNGSNMSSGGYFPITVNDATHITLQGTNTLSNFNLPTAGGLGFVYVESQPLSDFNGGMAITNVTNNGSGLIRITVNNSNQSFTGQSRICISGVGGTTEANGCFAINQVFSNSNQADLQGTTFTHTYTSGGTATYVIPNGGMIAVSDSNNMVIVPSNNDYPYCTTDGGQTWTQKRFPAGVAFGSSTGWSDSYFFFRRVFVADRVTPNTFYGYNLNQGVYKMTNCGTPTIVSGSALNGGTPNTPTANLFPASGAASTLKSVPGYAGHLFFTSGFIGSPTHPTNTSFYRSTDGGQNWYPVANVSEVIRFDCSGAVAPGSDYPTCYIVGWVNNVYGTWRTTGTAAQWGSAGTTGAGLTWTQVSDYPLGSMDGPQALVADGVTWNKWYEGFAGSGWAYGQQN